MAPLTKNLSTMLSQKSTFDLEDLELFKSSDHRGTRQHETEERRTLARRETRILLALRVAIYLTALIVAAVSSSIVYSYVKNSEMNAFQAHFQQYATKISMGYLHGNNCDLASAQLISDSQSNPGVLVVVLSNRMAPNEMSTYEIDGSTINLIGTGDYHDPEYDDMVVSKEDFPSLANDTSGVWNCFSYTATFKLYPTQDMEDIFSPKTKATKSAAITAAMFGILTLMFIFYDCVVGYRQKLLLNRAITTSAFVSSLYPKQVRDRLLFDQDDSDKSENSKSSQQQPPQQRRTSGMLKAELVQKVRNTTKSVDFLPRRRSNLGASKKSDPIPDPTANNPADDPTEKESSDGSQEETSLKSSPIIADLYPETTIMFADLAGFTKWSSTKEPKQVFLLLETLYQAFDKLAVRHSVFKVETIGDCYVAATGIPDPQPEHAIIMAKFALACQKCMHVLTKTLTTTLGEDVLKLAFRVGMHSGSITGGVLRGQKARFQLFGTTINTASRMESNGVPNQIHVSQATADEFHKFGYGDWLTPRKDKVVAKGLGEMKTYFVKYKEATTSATAESKAVAANDDAVATEDMSKMLRGILDCFLPVC